MQKLHRRLSPSLVVAGIALFVALSGTAIAGISKVIVKKPEQLADGVVTAPKLADDAVTNRALLGSSVSFDELQFPVLAAGVNKNTGGEPFFINPTKENVSVDRSGSRFIVEFDRSVRHCQWVATHANVFPEEVGGGFMFNVEPDPVNTRRVFVNAEKIVDGNPQGTIASFYLVGRC
jgi:hypothetical protein